MPEVHHPGLKPKDGSDGGGGRAPRGRSHLHPVICKKYARDGAEEPEVISSALCHYCREMGQILWSQLRITPQFKICSRVSTWASLCLSTYYACFGQGHALRGDGVLGSCEDSFEYSDFEVQSWMFTIRHMHLSTGRGLRFLD